MKLEEGRNYLKVGTRLLSVKVKCPDPGTASHEQNPNWGIAPGIKSPPPARTSPTPKPPPLSNIFIDRCITC